MVSSIIEYLSSINPVLAALYATLFTWGVTALGGGFSLFLQEQQ